MERKKLKGARYASKDKIVNIDELIAEKKKAVSQLAKEYRKVSSKDMAPFYSGTTKLKVPNAYYARLHAEIEVAKTFKPEKLPNDPEFLFEYAKFALDKRLKQLHNTLEQLNEAAEDLKKKFYCIPEQEIASSEEDLDFSDAEALEDEQVNFKLLQLLHQKVVKSLKLIGRYYYSSSSASETSEYSAEIFNGGPKKFDKTLKAFFIEFQDQPPYDRFENLKVEIDESFSLEHLQHLVDCDIIKKISDEPLVLSFKEH